MSTTTVKSLLKITAHKAVKFNSVSGQFFFGGGVDGSSRRCRRCQPRLISWMCDAATVVSHLGELCLKGAGENAGITVMVIERYIHFLISYDI